MDKKTENGEYVPTQYDLLVKYNQNFQPIEQISFEEFWKNEEIVSIDSENLELTIAKPDGVGSNKEYVFNNYKGYVKFTGWVNPGHGMCKVWVDGIELPESNSYATNSAGVPEFSFEGHVEEGIKIIGTAATTYTIINFSEFSTALLPNLSQDTKDFYSNIPEDNSDAWGELIIEAQAEFNGNLSWCEPLEDDSFDKMEFWNSGFVDSWALDGIDYGSKIYIGTVAAEESVKLNSGYGALHTQSFDKLPILIHENDIGKKNTIGPLKDDKGNEIYINLTII